MQRLEEALNERLLVRIEVDWGGPNDPPDTVAVAFLGKRREEGVTVGQHRRGGDDMTPLDHGHKLGHALGHTRGLEGQGEHGGEPGVSFGGGLGRCAQGLVQRPDGLDAVSQGLRQEVAAVDVEVRGTQAQHGVHEEIVLTGQSERQ